MKNRLKNQNAITLISLIITIVVLIILAGVAITLSLGDNGIFKKAAKAKEDTLVAQNEESMQIAEAINSIDGIVGSSDRETNTTNQTSTYDGTYCRIEKVGRICILTTKSASYNFSTWKTFTMETVPDEYKPLNSTGVCGAGGSGYNYQSMYIAINTDRTFTITNGNNVCSEMPITQLVYTSAK